MKIIKEGKLPERTKQKTCSYCTAVLEYEPADVTYDRRDGPYIVCPCCKKFLSV
jgi:RNase P subunit RPR2